MSRPQTAPLRPLTAAERTTLEQVARSGAERADRVSRAKALLAVAAGATFTAAARAAGRRSGDGVAQVVAQVVARCNAVGLAALDRRPGGHPRGSTGRSRRRASCARCAAPPSASASATAPRPGR